MARHRLQRFDSPAPSLSLLVHAAGAASFTHSFCFLAAWDTPISRAYGGNLQFLTIIGLAASYLCFALALVADVTRSPALFCAKNAVAVLAAPLEVVVSLLYFAICALDPKLIVQPGYELPLAVDLGFHLAPAAFLTLDLVLLSPPWTVPAYRVMAMATVVAFSYWYWVELCFAKNGWYAYPLFALLSTWQRVLLFVTSAALVTLSSGALKRLYAAVNGYEPTQPGPGAQRRLKKDQ